MVCLCFFFQAEDGIRDWSVTGVQTCALPISRQDVCDEFCTRSVPEAVAAPSELNVILGPRTMRTALSILIQPEPSVPAPTQTRPPGHGVDENRSEEHTSELQSLTISYAVFC